MQGAIDRNVGSISYVTQAHPHIWGLRGATSGKPRSWERNADRSCVEMSITTAEMLGRRKEKACGADQPTGARSSCTAFSVPGEMVRYDVLTFTVQWGCFSKAHSSGQRWSCKRNPAGVSW